MKKKDYLTNFNDIDTLDYIKSASKEISFLNNNLKKKTLAFQRLPFHKRRRNKNHIKKKTNRRRLNTKYNNKYKDNNRDEDDNDNNRDDRDKDDDKTINNKDNNKYYLDTHRYYSKRFNMIRLYNTYLPYKRTEKTLSFISKSKHRGYMCDETYMNVYKITNNKDSEKDYCNNTEIKKDDFNENIKIYDIDKEIKTYDYKNNIYFINNNISILKTTKNIDEINIKDIQYKIITVFGKDFKEGEYIFKNNKLEYISDKINLNGNIFILNNNNNNGDDGMIDNSDGSDDRMILNADRIILNNNNYDNIIIDNKIINNNNITLDDTIHTSKYDNTSKNTISSIVNNNKYNTTYKTSKSINSYSIFIKNNYMLIWNYLLINNSIIAIGLEEMERIGIEHNIFIYPIYKYYNNYYYYNIEYKREIMKERENKYNRTPKGKRIKNEKYYLYECIIEDYNNDYDDNDGNYYSGNNNIDTDNYNNNENKIITTNYNTIDYTITTKNINIDYRKFKAYYFKLKKGKVNRLDRIYCIDNIIGYIIKSMYSRVDGCIIGSCVILENYNIFNNIDVENRRSNIKYNIEIIL